MFLKNKKNLEKEIEVGIKQSYAEKDYIRCYNLMKLMIKVNKNNYVLKDYSTKIDEKQIEKVRKKWGLNGRNLLKGFIKSPKLYLTALFFLIFGRIK